LRLHLLAAWIEAKNRKNHCGTPEMIKAHKRKNSGSMRRASRVYLADANAGKVAALKAFLLLYVNGNYSHSQPAEQAAE
jgi:hypothetical protein